MKRLFLAGFVISVLTSCQENEGKRLLREYQEKSARAINFDLKDLDFEIISVEKQREILASDSMAVLKYKLAELWKQNPNQNLVDTLSFGFFKAGLKRAISAQDTLTQLHQEATLSAVKNGDFVERLESANKRDSAIREKFELAKALNQVEILEGEFNALAQKPDSVLSVVYIANYRIKNPMLGNAVQTFLKEFFTDANGITFVKEQDVNSEH